MSDREGPDYYARMTQARNDLENARLELQSAQEVRDAYKKELSGESPTFLIDESVSTRHVVRPRAARATSARAERRAISRQSGCPEGESAACGSAIPSASATT